MKDVKLIEQDKPKTNKKNIIIIVIAVVFLLTGLITFLCIYNSNTAKLDRYLTKKEYECTNIECTKTIDKYKYTINKEELTLTANSDNYIIKINNNEILLIKREDKSTCSYTKDNFKKSQLIDDTYTYTVYCQEHISEINEIITNYQTIIKEAKIKM